MALADEALLATDPTFISRVSAAMIAACIAIASEATGAPLHFRRVQYGALILNNPSNYKTLFAGSVATDTTCISDATAGNTVTLTAGNLAAQAALVTDAHINSAVSAQYNAFFSPV